MVKITCDRCGCDCNLVAYDILVRVLQNPVPTHISDTQAPAITSDKVSMRFTLCQKCEEKLGFPNIYKAQDTTKLEFKKEVGEDGERIYFNDKH